MKTIADLQHVSNSDTNRFREKLAATVNEMQDKGLEVVIQYSSAGNGAQYLTSVYYSALVLGYALETTFKKV